MKRAIIDLNLDPRVYTVSNFISPMECKAVIARAKGSNMDRAKVVGPKEGVVSDVRTNDVCWIDHNHDIAFSRIARRIAGLVGLPLSHAEMFQVIRYGPGAEYKPHYDAFDPTTETGRRTWSKGGQRLITALGYLNAVEEGGATWFSKLDMSVAPEIGKLLVFHNTEAGSIRRHPLSRHAGTPVIKGEKWAFNLWFRARSRDEVGQPPTEKELAEFTAK